MLTFAEDDPTAPEVPLDDLIAFAEDDPTTPEVPLDDLITYYTIRHMFYHQSSDEATLRLLVKTHMMQQALWELDTAGATASFIRFHKLSDTMLISPEEEG
jgi:D-serine deaminase-like pyridoxal phosphate-dependent protein